MSKWKKGDRWENGDRQSVRGWWPKGNIAKVEERGRLGKCTRVCVHKCGGGIERLPSTLLCKLTGLDVQLTGLFWQVSDGPYYYFTGGPLGPRITGHSPTAQPGGKKNKVAQRIKNTILGVLPSSAHYLYFSHSLEAWCMFAKCERSLSQTLTRSINMHIWMSLIDSSNLSISVNSNTVFWNDFERAVRLRKITSTSITKQSIQRKSLTERSVNRSTPCRLPGCVCTHGEQITSGLQGVVLWHQRVSLMWLQTSHQAIETIDLSLLTLESIIRAWRAGQIGGKWVKGCLI